MRMDKNCWSKPSTSISNQVDPRSRARGTARNTKMMTAVPIRALRAEPGPVPESGAASGNRTMASEPVKMISCAKWKFGSRPMTKCENHEGRSAAPERSTSSARSSSAGCEDQTFLISPAHPKPCLREAFAARLLDAARPSRAITPTIEIARVWRGPSGRCSRKRPRLSRPPTSRPRRPRT